MKWHTFNTTCNTLVNLLFTGKDPIQHFMKVTYIFYQRTNTLNLCSTAVAHAIGLSVGGPVHLQRIGLLTPQVSTTTGNSMVNIEYLLGIALDKLPFMAFSIALEKVCPLFLPLIYYIGHENNF